MKKFAIYLLTGMTALAVTTTANAHPRKFRVAPFVAGVAVGHAIHHGVRHAHRPYRIRRCFWHRHRPRGIRHRHCRRIGHRH